MKRASAVVDGEPEVAVAEKTPGGPRIWAVGGGKGGVGKSVITANLAIALAKSGHRCVMVDVDLGGANLHTVLGMPNPHRTLSHFLNGKETLLSQVMCESPVPNLWLVSGSGGLLEIANLKHFQKQKLLRHLRHLDVDDVLLDLGAGSSYNVLDFFLAARRGILVVAPERTSIENAYHFIKAAFYRWLRQVAKESAVREIIREALDKQARGRVRSPRELIAAVADVDHAAGKRLLERARLFAPMLIVNQVRKAEHHCLGREFGNACRSYLGTGIEYLGALEWDSCVADALSHGQPVLHVAPSCPFSQEIVTIAERLRISDDIPTEADLPRESCNGEERRPYDPTRLAMYGMLSTEERLASAENHRLRESASSQTAPPEPRPLRRIGLPPLDVSRPGAYLKHCRERLGLNISELSERTRIRSAHFEAIEGELFHRLPPEPYVRGFILQYARLLGIEDSEALAQSFSTRYRKALPEH